MRFVILSYIGLIVVSTIGAIRCPAAGQVQPGRNRIVRVVTLSQEGLDRSKGDLLESTMARLDRAGSFQPDIACLPELFSGRAPELVPGPVTDRVSAWARMHSSYVIFGLKTKKGNRIYNSAILLDRTGQVAGQYNKIHPTEGELRDGTMPGEDVTPPVFSTDFGTIGIQICFDSNWRDGWRRLKDEGAQIIFWPSAYPAAHQLPALALMNEYYIVSATMDGSAHVYDITGEVLASTGKYQDWAGAKLPLGKRLFEVDYNAPKAQQIQQKYGSRVEVTWYHDSDWFTLASLDPEVTVEELIQQFALVPLDDYIARCTKEINQARSEAGHELEWAK
ncbi:MAG: carbon-nitrogen hydrolase family protein [Terriglobia bacterium]